MDTADTTNTLRAPRLLTAQYLYLLTTPDGRSKRAGLARFPAITAGLVADLIIRGLVCATEGPDPVLKVVSSRGTGDVTLDRVLASLASKKNPTLSSVLNDPGIDVSAQVRNSLAMAGVVAVEPRRLLGLVPERVHTVDPASSEQIRRELREVLAGDTPEPTTAATLTVLDSLGLLEKALDLPDSHRKELTVATAVARCRTQPAAAAAGRVGDAAMKNSLAASVIITTANS